MDLTTTIVKGYDLSGGAANWTSADLSDYTNYYLDFIWSNVTGTLDGSLLILQTSDSIVFESIETFAINSKDETRLKNNIGLSKDKINVKFTPNSITGGRLTIKLRAIENTLQEHKANVSAHATMRANLAAGNITMTGDLTFVGSGSGIPYGFVEGDHIIWIQAKAVQDTWYNISDSDMSTRYLNTITHDGNGKMTIAKAGIYKVSFNVAYEVSAANVHIEIGIEVNGSGSADAVGPHAHTTSKFSNQEQDNVAKGYMNLAANSTIEVAIRTTDAGIPDFIVDNVHLTCDMIGGT